MADNNFNATVAALFKGIDGVISSKTVVGEAIQVGDITILPLVDVSFALGAGAFSGDNKEKGAGGLGGKTKLVNIKNQDAVTKILDMIPDVMDKFKKKEEKITEEDVIDILNEAE